MLFSFNIPFSGVMVDPAHGIYICYKWHISPVQSRAPVDTYVPRNVAIEVVTAANA